MSVADPTASRRLRASDAGDRDAVRGNTSGDKTQTHGDSGESNNTTGETGTSPPCNPVQEPEARPCTCRVVIAVKARWDASGYSALKSLECQCNDGVVVISGIVPCYHVKQLAQETIRSVEGVERIVNNLSVDQKIATDARTA